MPKRSFGRTVRYRRTRLGLSQARLGELVGRSPSTIKSWERDVSVPSDPNVIATLSAVLDFDERSLFEKAGLPPPQHEEVAEQTMEQALATLAPEELSQPLVVVPSPPTELGPEDEPSSEVASLEPVLDSDQTSRPIEPFYAYSTEQLLNATPPPPNAELSYMEDRGQRQLYRVRNLATIVILVGLVVVLLWSYTNAFDSFSAWWDDFFGSLRL